MKRILVASDGGPESEAALRFTQLLTQRYWADAEVVCVFAPRIPVPPPRAGSDDPECEPGDAPAAEALLSRVRELAAGMHLNWPVHLGIGHAPWVIARRAEERNADLIVLGHGTRRENDMRRHTRHTAEQIALACDVPVIAVPGRDGIALPRTAVAVHDDSSAGALAIESAESVLAPGGKLYVKKGEVGPALLSEIEEVHADLIAVPLPGDTYAVRSLMAGGVSDLLDNAKVDVIVVPARRAARTGRANSRREERAGST